MDIIFVSRSRGKTWRFQVGRRNVILWGAAASVGLALITSLVFVGSWAHARAWPTALPPGLLSSWRAQIDREQHDLAQTREQAVREAHAFSLKIAELQAQLLRLNAAGQRMAQIANIRSGEFDFSKPVPMGGPETGSANAPLAAMGDVVSSLDQLKRQLDDRERQMRVLEDMLVVGRLQKEVMPSGTPTGGGYITSGYGSRIDPFTGGRDFHPGVDFAGPEGSPVLAVGAGIVSDVGQRGGYGNMIEINHGNGYVTRYGHNAKFLVHAGDRVTRGQAIALMGSTGRSTGPHVHFEVMFDGHIVNPAQFIAAER